MRQILDVASLQRQIVVESQRPPPLHPDDLRASTRAGAVELQRLDGSLQRVTVGVACAGGSRYQLHHLLRNSAGNADSTAPVLTLRSKDYYMSF